MFDPKGVCFAVNGDEFWTYAKPFGIYITGKTNAETDDYFSNPAMLIDFLEPVNSTCGSLYMTDSDKNFNILICRDNGGCNAKKIFIDRCERFVKKIEYLNCSGKPAFVIESDEYKIVAGENFLFPHKLTYRYFERHKSRDRLQIKLDTVKPWQASPEQLKALFSPPDANSIQKETK